MNNVDQTRLLDAAVAAFKDRLNEVKPYAVFIADRKTANDKLYKNYLKEVEKTS